MRGQYFYRVRVYWNHNDPDRSETNKGEMRMKKILLAMAMMSALTMGTIAAEQGAGAVKEKPKHAEMTQEQREARMNKRLEAIKAKDEALYKELIALKEKDPEAFRAKMRELGRQEHAKNKGHGKGKAKGEQAPAAPAENK